MTGTEQTTAMAGQADPMAGEGRYVRANGTDIYYVEAGQGEPLLLLHGGLVSSSPVWRDVPIAWVSHIPDFARHFRVIAPDTRGHGRTVNPDGPISYARLADDIVALIEALNLKRPLICGFSDGGTIATVVALRHPGLVRAVVNDAGYDLFNAEAPSFTMARQVFGGSPAATRADAAAAEHWFDSEDELRRMFDLVKADHDAAQGAGYWKTLLTEMFDRLVQSPGYTFNDFTTLTAPTLIQVGDRDHVCSPEEAVAAYRTLPVGELAIIPNTGHRISPLKVQIAIDFLRRHSTS